MDAYERQAKTLELLKQHSYVTVEDLSRITGVSKMTIRRDLDQLQESNLVARHHGGVSLVSDHTANAEWPWRLRQTLNAEAKKKIGTVAASYIKDGDIVMLDGGSTVLQVARSLAHRNLTVVSYCLTVLWELSSRQNMEVIGVGGKLLPDNQSFVGSWTLNILRSMNADVGIVGTSCLSLNKGLSNRAIEEAELKRTIVDASAKSILVADSSKMHTHSLVTVGPIEMFDIFITDPGIANEDRKAIEALGVEVVVAE